jgi:hypothetical protein
MRTLPGDLRDSCNVQPRILGRLELHSVTNIHITFDSSTLRFLAILNCKLDLNHISIRSCHNKVTNVGDSRRFHTFIVPFLENFVKEFAKNFLQSVVPNSSLRETLFRHHHRTINTTLRSVPLSRSQSSAGRITLSEDHFLTVQFTDEVEVHIFLCPFDQPYRTIIARPFRYSKEFVNFYSLCFQ